MISGLKQFCAEKLKSRLFSLEKKKRKKKKRVLGDLMVTFQYLKVANKKEEIFFAGPPIVTGQRGNGLKLKEGIFMSESGETLEKVFQTCFIPGSVQCQVGWSPDSLL